MITNNHILTASLLLAGVCVAPSQLWAAEVDVSLSPSLSSFAPGQMLTLAINANVADPIVGFGVDFGFDPSILSLTGITIGPMWFAAAGSEPNDVAGLAFPNPVNGSNILLASLSFTALSAGTPSDVSVFYDSHNLSEGFPLVLGGFATTNLTDESLPSQVPEPSSFILVTSGLLYWVLANEYKRHASNGHRISELEAARIFLR